MGIVGGSSGYVAPVLQNPNPRRRVRGSGSQSGGTNSIDASAGAIRLSRREYVMDVTGGTVSWFELMPLRFAWLKGLAKNFDRYRWLSAVVEYKPAVGTTTTGLMAFGPDWNSGTSTTTYTREEVLAATPLSEAPVWQQQSLPLPKARLMSRKDYRISTKDDTTWDDDSAFDVMPCFIMWATTGAKSIVGELWVSYTVELIGTRKA